jgi:hypothetical protein
MPLPRPGGLHQSLPAWLTEEFDVLQPSLKKLKVRRPCKFASPMPHLSARADAALICGTGLCWQD